MRNQTKMELLAPAGNMDCLKAAVQSGADAVYFAGKQFGARSFADNFSEEEIKAAADYCRLYGAKSYVTVNTMTLDREFSALDRYIKVLADSGIDGVIVQDIGVMTRIHQLCPSLPLHGSTQMTVHNLAGVKALERMGAKRVVLAREMSAQEIAHVIRHCTAEIEVFVHGAMCMSYSGQCLMSSVLGGRSGNRGKCAQPCRLPYRGKDGAARFYLSLKDMSLLSHLEQLSEMGVSSLKIEGRMKGVSYVSAVVQAYRSCIDSMRRPNRDEEERLRRVFFRGGLTDGYFTGRTGTDMFAFDKPDNPYAKNQKDEIPLPERKIAANANAYFAEGERPSVTLTSGKAKVTVTLDTVLETAQNSKAARAEIEKQLRKTGGTPFRLDTVTAEVTGSPYIPVKITNQLRRKGLEELAAALSKTDGYPFLDAPRLTAWRGTVKEALCYTASVRDAEQFETVKKYPFYKIDVPIHQVEQEPERYLAEKNRILLALPAIVPDGRQHAMNERLNRLYDMGFCALRAENIGQLAWERPFAIWGGHRLNLANSMALHQLSQMGAAAACVSAELNLAQIRDLSRGLWIEAIAYGHIPLMVTQNCVLKNIGRCPCHGGEVICDRKGNALPVVKDGADCRSVILNSIPLYMGDKKEELRRAGADSYRLCFTVETAKRCDAVCRLYFEGGTFSGKYTRFHYLKGIE